MIGSALCVRKLPLVEYEAAYPRSRFDPVCTRFADIFAEPGESPDCTIEHEINLIDPLKQFIT